MAVSRVGRKGGKKVFKYGRKSPWVPTLTELFPKIQAVVEHAISCRACGMPIRFPVNMKVYGRYLKEGFLYWLLHVVGRPSTTDEQRKCG